MANDDASKQQALANLKDTVNSRDAKKQTVLHHAVIINQKKAVKALIAAGADLKAEDYLGVTPLHHAQDPDVAQTLIAAGADIKAKDEGGYTPLHYAENPDVAQALIEAGADITAKNNNGNTPLHIAAMLDRLDVVKALIEAGADITAKNIKGRTPLDIATEKHNYKTRDYLASLEVIKTP